MKDNRGTELEIGQTVCYNWQGQVALGVIEKITEAQYRNATPYDAPFISKIQTRKTAIKIKRIYPEKPHAGYLWKDFSTVTDPKNLMVIFEK